MIFCHGLILSFFLSLIMLGLTYLFFFIFPYLRQPKEILKETISFLKILSISIIPWMIFEIFRKFSEGLSLIYPGLIITWIAVAINILLNYIFINGFFFIPKIGLLGIAYATLISRTIMLLGIIFLLFKYKKFYNYQYYLKYFFFNKKYLFKILKIGIPSGLQMVFEMGAFSVCSFISGKLGTKVIAAHQIIINLISSTFLLSTGFSVAATIRVSKQLALKKYSKLEEIVNSIIFMVFIFMSVCSFSFLLFLDKIPQIYNIKKYDYEMNFLLKKMILIASIFQIPDGLQGMILGALRGLQDVKIPMLISFFSYWIIALPISYVLSKKIGGHGIWIGLGTGLTISAILLFIRYNFLLKKLKNKLLKK